MAVSFPALAPSELTLRLPNYPVLVNLWRATETPEILGNLPVGAELRLTYRNVPDVEAVALLQVWRATAGGVAPLNALPAEVAAGILDADLAARILAPPSMVWAMAEPPRQESVKAGRSTISITLTSELRTAPVQTLTSAACPVYVPRTDECVPSSP